MAKAIVQSFPGLRVHGSTQMSVHSLAGVEEAARIGLSRVILARELSLEDIAFICKNSPVEIEVFVHGALCLCYSGQCYFSGQIGERSGNRGRCAQVCRLPYGLNQKKDQAYPMSLKDLCRLQPSISGSLRTWGKVPLKIEGRMKRPRILAVVYRNLQ
jgi:putative protease